MCLFTDDCGELEGWGHLAFHGDNYIPSEVQDLEARISQSGSGYASVPTLTIENTTDININN